MSYIPLTQRRFARVDEADFDELSRWRWHLGGGGYAMRKQYFGRDPKTGMLISRYVMMHRVIANTPSHLTTDHINGDRLDNRRLNLRNCTQRKNSHNTGSRRPSLKSPYVGVTELPSARWRAVIRPNGQRIHLGCFATPEEAAEAYNRAAREHYGDFAKLNKVYA